MAKKGSKAYELEIKIAGAVAKSLGTSVAKVEKHFNRIKKAGEFTGKAVVASGKVMGAGLAAAGAGAVALGTQAVKSAVSVDKAMDDLAAGTNLSKTQLQEYENVLKSVYANNYGESFEDIGDKMKAVNQQMGNLSEKDMQKVVESGYLLQDTFDMEFNESLRGADALMTQFGVDAQTAYNLIAQGAKNGLNQNDDLADQLAEYSVYYSNLGFTAEEMMNMIATGAQDGAYQIDYLNDAMKEFGIRAIDNSDSTKEAFAALGLNSSKTMAAFAKGGEASKAAFKDVTTALAAVDNEVKRNEIGVALFGTKWEDLGESAVMAMANAGNAINSSVDALAGMEAVKYADLESMFQGLTRSVEVALLPLGEALIPIIGNLMGQIGPVITDVLGTIDIGMLSELASTILPIVSDVLAQISPSLGQILPPLLSTASTLVQMLLPVLGDLINAVLPAVVPLLDPLLQIVLALAPVLESLGPCVSVLAQVLSGVLVAAIETSMPIVQGLTTVLTGVLDFITNIFTGKFSAAFENLVQIFSGVWQTLKAAFVQPINFIIRGLNAFIGYLNKLTIPDWVPGVGGKGLNFSLIPEIALAEGGIAMGPTNALIGEGGEPEAVVPLSKLPTLLPDEDDDDKPKKPRGGGGGDGSVVIYATFAPVIHCNGGDEGRISEIMDDEYERFKEFMDQYIHEYDRTKL
ncbi:MAG: phage tail tape measure protein [Acutalibacteraceae bacterium]|nr:phage tail tape measure protein [Acutalibacteraceae bacterium]